MSCHRRAVSLAFLAVTVGFGTSASADVLPPDWEPPTCPPMTCPPGSSPLTTGHGGCPVGCTPNAPCQTDADCTAMARSTCVDTRFCTEDVFAGRAGDLPVVRGDCGADDACETGTCSVARRCTTPALTPRPTSGSTGSAAEDDNEEDTDEATDEDDDDDGCSVAGRPPIALGVVLALLAVGCRRRRLKASSSERPGARRRTAR